MTSAVPEYKPEMHARIGEASHFRLGRYPLIIFPRGLPSAIIDQISFPRIDPTFHHLSWAMKFIPDHLLHHFHNAERCNPYYSTTNVQQNNQLQMHWNQILEVGTPSTYLLLIVFAQRSQIRWGFTHARCFWPEEMLWECSCEVQCFAC